MSGNRFPKSERLSGKKNISRLYSEGRRRPDAVIGLHFIQEEAMEEKSTLAVVFSVPRKKFKNAVDRNLLKRRMREAFRLNKKDLIAFLESNNKRLELMFVYSSAEIKLYKEIEEKIRLHLKAFLPENEDNP